MSRAPHSFKRTDVKRAYRAALDAGIPYPRVVIDTVNHTLTIMSGEPPQENGKPDSDTTNVVNPWDELLTNAAHEKRPA